MSKGLPLNTGDENIEGGSYESAAPGKHTVTGIKEFFNDCLDDSGPIFVERNGELKISFEFRKEDDSKGPTFSATPAEFLALATAFGVTLDGIDITRKNRTSPAVVLAVKDAINAANKRITVEANDEGWVNRIDDAVPPVDTKYTVQFKEAIGSDGDLSWFPSKYGGFLIFKFEIVGDGRGKPSIWEGYNFTLFMNNDFVREADANDGRHLIATEEQRPLYRSTENGGVPASAMRWTNFALYFAPGVLEHEWAVSPDNSEYNICEVFDPQVVFVKKALKDRKVVVFFKRTVSRNTKKVSYLFDLNELSMTNDIEDFEAAEPEAPSSKALDTLLAYINDNKEKWDILPEIDLFENSPVDSNVIMFTDAGKAWASQHLLPAWKTAGLGDKKPLHELTDKEASALLAAFTSSW